MNNNSKHILLVEDDADLRAGLVEFLRSEGFDVSEAPSGEDAIEQLRKHAFDMLITDVELPGIDGVSLMREALAIYPAIIPIVITGHGTVQLAVDAMRSGARDFVSKPFRFSELRDTVVRAATQPTGKRPAAPVRREEAAATAQPGSMVGRSNAMVEVFNMVDTIAGTTATVLITGETGTGKELIARSIHEKSPRRDQKMVSLNCGAIPENLLESELFGHVKGAFTGAQQTRIGRFEQAHKGTIFLDEIGNMSVNLQVKLLRVLQEREFERIGGMEKIKVDVRIIAATSANLKEMVAKGEFREDLYYRLNVIPIRVPALRERRDDIAHLASHFVAKFSEANEVESKIITQESMKSLMNYNWPGNVRELENAIERAVALTGTRTTIQATDLPEDVQKSTGCLFLTDIYIPDEGLDFNTEISEIERKLILGSLKKANGNKAEAAQLLQLKRTTLIEKLRRLKVDEDELEAVSA